MTVIVLAIPSEKKIEYSRIYIFVHKTDERARCFEIRENCWEFFDLPLTLGSAEFAQPQETFDNKHIWPQIQGRTLTRKLLEITATIACLTKLMFLLAATGGIITRLFFFLSSYSFQILHQCSSFQTLNLTLVVEIVGKKVPRLPAGSTEKGRKLGWEASDGLAINPSVFNFYRIVDIHAVC